VLILMFLAYPLIVAASRIPPEATRCHRHYLAWGSAPSQHGAGSQRYPPDPQPQPDPHPGPDPGATGGPALIATPDSSAPRPGLGRIIRPLRRLLPAEVWVTVTMLGCR
jgi:hypothetical protein